MKKNVLLIALIAILSGVLSTSMTRINPSNPPLGNTGAPGETTCQKSGCHSGGSYTGVPTLTGLPDSVDKDATYNLTLTINSDCVKSGFELTCLDQAEVKCGTLTTGTGTSVGTFTGKQYIRQSTPHTLVGGTTSWNFTWKAPTSADHNTITFYFSMLNANGNGHDSGDNVCNSNMTVFLKDQVITEVENVTSHNILFTPNPAHDLVTVANYAPHSNMVLYDMQGNVVMTNKLNEDNTNLDISNLPRGVYNALILSEKSRVVKKMILQ